MICDADVHFCPKNLFDDLKPIYPDFVDFYNNLCWGYDFDSVWSRYYNAFKDPSWPECHTKDSFNNLPLHCRLEIKADLDKSGDNLFKINKEKFSFLYFFMNCAMFKNETFLLIW